ncbi:beta-1,3-galactosyl-o-glycosyl-glycoprotein beta-1,6-n-acetylglucosaminyltransferase 3 [Plakobranchus ocellatus]|uniref:Beta-1,3-galactosyl-o-glycosyl-glycoprotein beta-1,6-n-acetylglucosaminyltransferase 3 n=1 Tax=Plakobranchus ocellatus TaxID=259542 RepID=A0AAV4CZV5_9GAST|nr:beta-1,3-galactosyl-o-glycosyl-glycoprotein beta-1,6-n-acetylglucosaminyltransferase 3 [Plakobranchus ocellatus]
MNGQYAMWKLVLNKTGSSEGLVYQKYNEDNIDGKNSNESVVFLLRAIYRSHNVYCLNIDTKAGQEMINAARALARCVPNVFVASRLERVVYEGFSRLQADINCLGDLLQHPVRWRYVINMPGQQFPLR